MKANRSLFLHGGLLLAASALAYSGFTKSAPPPEVSISRCRCGRASPTS